MHMLFFLSCFQPRQAPKAAYNILSRGIREGIEEAADVFREWQILMTPVFRIYNFTIAIQSPIRNLCGWILLYIRGKCAYAFEFSELEVLRRKFV